MSYQELTKEHRAKMQSVLYYMGKSAARDSFSEFLEHCDCTLEEWREIKVYIQDQLGVKLYV
jgi:anti-sigma regulatory factor (Ser/Thr protein kinase)